MATTLPSEAQQLTIANFPKHRVARLASWEWRIYNDNVTFVSCDEVHSAYTARAPHVHCTYTLPVPCLCHACAMPVPCLCDQAGTLTYSERSFNAERHEVIHPALAAAEQQQAANATALAANAAALTQVDAALAANAAALHQLEHDGGGGEEEVGGEEEEAGSPSA